MYSYIITCTEEKMVIVSHLFLFFTGIKLGKVETQQVDLSSKRSCRFRLHHKWNHVIAQVAQKSSLAYDLGNSNGRFYYELAVRQVNWLCGFLICTTTCPAACGKRTYSKITTDRKPCRNFFMVGTLMEKIYDNCCGIECGIVNNGLINPCEK